MYEPDVSGGVTQLSVIGACGNVGFPSRFSSFGNLLFSLRKKSESVDHSEHVLVYPMYQLPIFVVPPDCLLRVLGHALVVVLARVPTSSSAMALPHLSYLEFLPLSSSCCVWCPGIHVTFMVSTPLATIAFSQNCHRSPSGLLVHRVGLSLLSLILLRRPS